MHQAYYLWLACLPVELMDTPSALSTNFLVQDLVASSHQLPCALCRLQSCSVPLAVLVPLRFLTSELCNPQAGAPPRIYPAYVQFCELLTVLMQRTSTSTVC